MQVSAVPLKLGRKQNRVCVIDLLPGIAPSAPHAADASVSRLQFIQGDTSHSSPSLQRRGWHCGFPQQEPGRLRAVYSSLGPSDRWPLSSTSFTENGLPMAAAQAASSVCIPDAVAGGLMGEAAVTVCVRTDDLLFWKVASPL